MKISILDCTLRDGGYINQWRFTEKQITSILNNLALSNIDYIECGYLKFSTENNSDTTLFKKVEQIRNYLPFNKKSNNFVVMINYGEYPIEHLPVNNGEIFGIRVAFRRQDWQEAMEYCQRIKDKGYYVFIQPMITINYSDIELLDMIQIINDIQPYAVYIVDSFGVMKPKDLLRLTYLLDHNLESKIKLGFHGHNNLQLVFSNATHFVESNITRDIIIDSSVYGMGRGAGNLNTELFVEYLNDRHAAKYVLTPLLKIIDESLMTIYQENYWGYSLPYFIAARNNCHPNYANYLLNKNSLNVEDIERIIKSIEDNKKDAFDKLYIEDIYINYQTRRSKSMVLSNDIHEVFAEKDVLIIGPGKSILSMKNIDLYAENQNNIVVSVNFIPQICSVDYIFISNSKRFEHLDKSEKPLIVTSNINYPRADYKVDYKALLHHDLEIHDNALVMLLKLLINSNAHKAILIGFDGYEIDINENYSDADHIIPMDREKVQVLNRKIGTSIQELSSEIEIVFNTPSKYFKTEDHVIKI